MVISSLDPMSQVHTVATTFHSVKDLMVISPTGSGKSNAYKMPILMERKKVAASVCRDLSSARSLGET